MKKFNCTSCGECCRHISHIIELKEFDLGDGICMHLQNDNQCSIYNNRPDICKIDVMYETHYSNQLPELKFIELNANACNTLQEDAGLNIDFRVKL